MNVGLHVSMNTGAQAELGEVVVEAFRASLRGHLLRAGEDGYEKARKVFNAMIDRRPALIARCAGVADGSPASISPGCTSCWWRCMGAATVSPAMRYVMAAWCWICLT
jgi:hypothetical protein